MSHKITYWLAMLMIPIATFILYRYNFNFWERTCIITYMIIYGALIAWSATK